MQDSKKIELILNSDSYWDKYWDKIDKAKKNIFIVTYDCDHKNIASRTIDKLLCALDRGVKVVFILDHLNFYIPKSDLKLLKGKGAVVIKYNNMKNAILKGKKFFHRTHQKVTLIDKDLFIGSINIGEEYSGHKYGSCQFVDLNIFVKETICYNKILIFFKEMIDLSKKSRNEWRIREFLNSEIKPEIKLPSKNEEFLEEHPHLDKSESQDCLFDLLVNSEKSITIIQGYYNNIDRLEELLENALDRGVKIKIITSHKRDQPAYASQYNSEIFKRLILKGAEVKEYYDKNFHIKAYYVDEKFLHLGSMNHDNTSLLLNGEANYLVRRSEMNTMFFNDLERVIRQIEKNCRVVTVNYRKSYWRTFKSYCWDFFLFLQATTVEQRKSKISKD